MLRHCQSSWRAPRTGGPRSPWSHQDKTTFAQLQEWLYDHPDDPKEAFVQKLNELKVPLESIYHFICAFPSLLLCFQTLLGCLEPRADLLGLLKKSFCCPCFDQGWMRTHTKHKHMDMRPCAFVLSAVMYMQLFFELFVHCFPFKLTSIPI